MNRFINTSDQSGIVFDIQRCSMHDGPGIRTTVFLKGCPLSCKWCHNPESQNPQAQLAFFAEKCVNCGTCAHLHPEAHIFDSEKVIHAVLYKNCTLCGRCVDTCPTAALKIYGNRTTVDEVIDIAQRDQSYYRETGGGITFSGGEPFVQFKFLLALLTESKKHGFSTCVETSGHVPITHLEHSLPYIDLFLFDYKETSPEKHRAFTGVDNRLILSNLDFLYQNGKEIILRCPVIPGYNDTSEHFTGIAMLEKHYPKLAGIEILPYHDLGKTKALAIGSAYEVSAPTADASILEKWKGIMSDCGCSARILGSF